MAKLICGLPRQIVLKCGTVLSYRIGLSDTAASDKIIIHRIKASGGKYRIVHVLGRNLRGKEDLHRQPYRANRWLLTNVKV